MCVFSCVACVLLYVLNGCLVGFNGQTLTVLGNIQTSADTRVTYARNQHGPYHPSICQPYLHSCLCSFQNQFLLLNLRGSLPWFAPFCKKKKLKTTKAKKKK